MLHSCPSSLTARGRDDAPPGGSSGDSQLDRQVYGTEFMMA
jgi:hypothetical protein